MTLPASGQISLSQVNTELGRASNTAINMNESAVRTLAGVGGAGSAWSMNSLYGKSSLTVTGVNDDRFYVSSGSGSASSFPSVNVSGGQAPYTYSWTFTNNPQSAGLSNSNSQTATVNKNFTSGSTGSYSATLQCVVTDNSGTQRTVGGITASASWEP